MRKVKGLAEWAKGLEQMEFEFTEGYILEMMKELEQHEETTGQRTGVKGSAEGKFKGVKSIQTTFERDTE